jgi:hypothetical protein
MGFNPNFMNSSLVFEKHRWAEVDSKWRKMALVKVFHVLCQSGDRWSTRDRNSGKGTCWAESGWMLGRGCSFLNLLQRLNIMADLSSTRIFKNSLRTLQITENNITAIEHCEPTLGANVHLREFLNVVQKRRKLIIYYNQLHTYTCIHLGFSFSTIHDIYWDEVIILQSWDVSILSVVSLLVSS